MGEKVTPPPPKGIGSVNLRDLVKGLYYATGTQIGIMIWFVIKNLLQEEPAFPTWAEWLPYLNIFVAQLVTYLLSKFGINNVGQIFTANKPVQQIAVDTLTNLKERAAFADTTELPTTK